MAKDDEFPNTNKISQSELISMPGDEDEIEQQIELNLGINIPIPRQFVPPSYGETIINNEVVYSVGKLIGKGNFSEVYECVDAWANELVAKVILPNGSYDEVRDRCLKEIDSLLSFRHPNITYVYDAFEYRDTFYIIMEKCYSTLESLISTSGVVGEIWLPYIARDILQALHSMHRKGFVHKDLHAGNMFVSHLKDKMVPSKAPVWAFKIGDLGIANFESNIDTLGTILAEWMLPPEFLNPEFGVLDRRVDIYHFGLVLLQLVSNTPLSFNRDEILAGKPRQMAEEIRSPFGPIIAIALRRHVKDRYQSAFAFWRDILVVQQSSANGK